MFARGGVPDCALFLFFLIKKFKKFKNFDQHVGGSCGIVCISKNYSLIPKIFYTLKLIFRQLIFFYLMIK